MPAARPARAAIRRIARGEASAPTGRSGVLAGLLALAAVAAMPVSGLVGVAPDEPDGPPAAGASGAAPATATVRAVPDPGGDGAPEPTDDGAAVRPTAHRPDVAAPDEESDEPADASGTSGVEAPWAALADCESGDRDRAGEVIAGSARWDYGLTFAHEGYEQFEGGLNFHPETWDDFRDPDMPDHAGRASPAQEVRVGERVQREQGWQAWPRCAARLGLLDR